MAKSYTIRFCWFYRVQSVPFKETTNALEAAKVAQLLFEAGLDTERFELNCRAIGYVPEVRHERQTDEFTMTLHRRCCGYGNRYVVSK